jgi:hypothetical protein
LAGNDLQTHIDLAGGMDKLHDQDIETLHAHGTPEVRAQAEREMDRRTDPRQQSPRGR